MCIAHGTCLVLFRTALHKRAYAAWILERLECTLHVVQPGWEHVAWILEWLKWVPHYTWCLPHLYCTTHGTCSGMHAVDNTHSCTPADVVPIPINLGPMLYIALVSAMYSVVPKLAGVSTMCDGVARAGATCDTVCPGWALCSVASSLASLGSMLHIPGWIAWHTAPFPVSLGSMP